MTKLKRCPFCGGKAKVQIMKILGVPHWDSCRVYCEKCEASTCSFFETEEDAIDAWNRREGEDKR